MKKQCIRILLYALAVFCCVVLAVSLQSPAMAADDDPFDPALQKVTVTIDYQGKMENETYEVYHGDRWDACITPVHVNWTTFPYCGDFIFMCYSLEPVRDNPSDAEVAAAAEGLRDYVCTEDTTIYVVCGANYIDVAFDMRCDEIPSFQVRVPREAFQEEGWLDVAFPDGLPSREGYELMGFAPQDWEAYTDARTLADDMFCARFGPAQQDQDGRFIDEFAYYAVWFEAPEGEARFDIPVCGESLFDGSSPFEAESGADLPLWTIPWAYWDIDIGKAVEGGAAYTVRFQIIPVLGSSLRSFDFIGAESIEMTRNDDLSFDVEATVRAVHCYDGPEFVWADDYSSACATFTCAGCGDKRTVTVPLPETVEISPATQTEDRVVKYTATVTFGGEEYRFESDNIVLEGTATGTPDSPDQPDDPDLPEKPSGEEPSGTVSGFASFLAKLTEFFRSIRAFFLRLFNNR